MEQNNHQDHPQQDHSRPQHWFRKGVAAAWPICLGYLPVGLACGALAQQAGLPFWAVGLMSILVFAGSAQFIAISMLAAGASPISIILTTFIVNLRHTLMSSTLAVYLQGVNRWFLSLFAYGVTDESFAVNMTRFRTGEWNRWQALTVNHLSNSAWVAATTCGALVGQLIPERALGMDYAMTGMFISLLTFQLQNWTFILTGLLAGLISVTCYLLIPGDSYIIIASVSGATLGYMIKRRSRKRT
ncbi:MAG: AzlC family ABC transporter permease [Proteobacteria bacterium]|nr:AzlC family ABC transporter permease [Pseudomonadota bacterium]MBU4328138.1 AzlC family ABC transporter permease [Pseudomonadota bacterium]